MKRILFFSLILLWAISAYAQQKVSYAYDAAGNRTSRTIVLETRSASALDNPIDSVFHEETLAEKQVRIYPNPVETQLTIQISAYTQSLKGAYSLYYITGTMVAKGTITGETT